MSVANATLSRNLDTPLRICHTQGMPKKDFPSLRPFSIAFAAQYRGFMKSENITQQHIADVIKRDRSYVSERVNGLRPIDTDDVDALASLTGWTGRDLLIELSKRARTLTVVPALEDEEPAVSEAPVELPRAAKRGRRKADDVGEAE